MAYNRKRLRLGELLLENNLITEEQLNIALEEQKAKGIKLGEAIIGLGYVTQDAINDLLCQQLNIDFVDLRKIEIDDSIARMVGEKVVRKYMLLPFALDDRQANVIKVAMEDPMNIMAIDDIGIITGMTVQPYLSTHAYISTAIDKLYGKSQANAIAEQFMKEQGSADDADNAEENKRQEDVDNSPVVKLVNNIIEGGVRQRASDIHIEPFEYNVRVRYRIDGVLREIISYDRALYAAIIARLKVISGMDISEKRKPQDGRITITVDRREYDIRVSNLPTVFGEKVVMRLASKEGFKRDKKDLGLSPTDLVKFDNILRNPHGIILVTGPTGSGKSTTLYTALSELASDEVNIITVEDPVEANVDNVNQVQVNVKADLTFASALRSILRQDPDIIMIGEIRDGETAEIAVKASITGHLVVSTLHTNSTAASISRLIDMGIEPYLLGDSLVGIIAQRLVRRLCPECKESYEADEEEKRVLKVPQNEPLKLYKACGCEACGNTGYYGRIGVYEIMPISRKIKNLIASGANADDITAQAVTEGMNTLRMSASNYVKQGLTSFSEMMKITYETDDTN
ncbi:MAG: ATPase, T2SS/T4P/T4SS family [Butyrivibrio crossotus]|nr:Flp pilus assembly complex ATPase component TadA [Butyrivibrio crossotus]MDY4029250.1 ATPase, T2SS/T4P/T4SS family [Butyrivibrio crossotus]